MRNRVFHQATIAGLTFEGVMTASGPSVACQAGGGVALGVSGLRQFQPETAPHRGEPRFGWWVVKYRDEARIGLPGFGPAHIRRLSDEFGLVILTERDPCPADRTRQHYFFTSPAWDALRQWVAKHPRIAKAHAEYDPYLPSWHERAMAEAAVLRAQSRLCAARVKGTGHGLD